MSRPALEVADIFRDLGSAWRSANAGHVSLDQLKVMSAIERCRTAALGGHVARCEKCSHTVIAYNSCRNRHCPKCQGAAAKQWLAEREAELLPVPYFHVVFTLPAPVVDIAYQNKAVIYDLLFKAAADTTLTIAADPKHLGARIGITAVLHTGGSAMTHHPHLHMIVPGGGLSLDGKKWLACRPGFFLPVRVLSRLFRRLFLKMLADAHAAARLAFFGDHAALADAAAFAALLTPLRKTEWVVYAIGERLYGHFHRAGQSGGNMTVRAQSFLHQFLSLVIGLIFPEGDKRLSIEPKRAAILVILLEELLQRFSVAALHQTTGKLITDALVVVGIQPQHIPIVAYCSVNLTECVEGRG
jgi:hypothetical protein